MYPPDHDPDMVRLWVLCAAFIITAMPLTLICLYQCYVCCCSDEDDYDEEVPLPPIKPNDEKQS
uniref:Protein shisa-5 n=1 Tax=Steinernema glaseri TaxID=37863 RepID=A0A1I7Y501_9BILA